MYRNNPAVSFCKQAVRAGWLGDIFEIHAVMSRLDGDDYRQWIANFEGGALYIFGGYLIDLEHHHARYALDPLHVHLTLAEACEGFSANSHLVEVGVIHGRYTAQLTELDRMIRGEIENPSPYRHEYLVHETLLAAAGYTTLP